MPNIHALKLGFISIDDREDTLTEQSQSFQYVYNRNMIKSIIVNEKYSLQKIKILVALCPHVEYLNIGTERKALALIMRFLLSQTNAGELFFLCTSGVPKSCRDEVQKLIQLEKLVRDYLIEFINGNLYLWW
ncbi:unnamed protein product [Rotaria socialis]|uniref:Uncharacterized protein n=2 Tax=Rotaria socialis TaxID=392032 RepID=A0A817TIG3_9BILA|nr:unnamed protein product [Rotaria socialis]CAF3565559.1 unnamed protein product [Rotaria socialis]CAF4709092.1 unnamed protein product [Rotaria socialis]